MHPQLQARPLPSRERIGGKFEDPGGERWIISGNREDGKESKQRRALSGTALDFTILALLLIILMVSGGCESTVISDELGLIRMNADVDAPQGYKNCPRLDPKKTNIHLICHTHNDVGWVKTADEYYYGARRDENTFSVEEILDSVVSELIKNKERRFIYAESAFLWKWWHSKDEISKGMMKQLVQEGRLQFVGGGWVMSDEATPHYSALIDQMTLGLRFLKDTFGEAYLPRIAWQIDSFGHSAEVAEEFSLMGFDGLFFSRIHQDDYIKRKNNKSLEMIWRPDTRRGPDTDIFTGEMYNNLQPYHPPDGLCFDKSCIDEPVVDDPTSPLYNVKNKAEKFIQEIRKWKEPYNTTNAMVTMGGDFHYASASYWFNNLERLIRYTNENSADFHVVYSTPACYLKALNRVQNHTWPVKDDSDFFPYAGVESENWTGYYTSRPCFKSYVYRANNIFQACKQLRTVLGDKFEEEQMVMARAMASAQHHDAISGTEKSFVADDYKKSLLDGIAGCEKIFNATLSSKQNGQHQQHPTSLKKVQWLFCSKLNSSECNITENSQIFAVSIYNPHGMPKSPYVSIPVKFESYLIRDATGKELPGQVIKLSDEDVKRMSSDELYKERGSPLYELIFKADSLPPLGRRTFHVEKRKEEVKGAHHSQEANAKDTSHDLTVENGVLKLTFNQNGLLSKIERKNETWTFKQEFLSYKKDSAIQEGAYLFNPEGEALPILQMTEKVKLSIVKDTVITEVRQMFNDWLSQTIRMYAGQDQIEFRWLVGPLPMACNVITRYTVNEMSDDSDFYTDSNGRRLILRTKAEKGSAKRKWDPNSKKENLRIQIASSYFPITSAAVLQDHENRITVLTDRPQGAASLRNNNIEIMLHRMTDNDDGKGLNEPLNETENEKGSVAKGVHIVQLSKSTGRLAAVPTFPDGASRHRSVAQELVLQPVYSFANIDQDFAEWKESAEDGKGLIATPLPENVHLLTLERWTSNSLLIRLEHIFEPGEHPELSKEATIVLSDLFTDFAVERAVELSLAATFKKDKMGKSWRQMKWMHDGAASKKMEEHSLTTSLKVVLQPMEIRTFELFITTRKFETSDSGRQSAITFKFCTLMTIAALTVLFVI